MFDWRYPDKPTSSTLAFVKQLRGNDWIAQAKLDGWRVLVYVDENVSIYTRHNTTLEQALKQPIDMTIINALKQLKQDKLTIYDGEYIGRRSHKDPSIGLFDIMMLNGEWITNKPCIERWNILKEIMLKNKSNLLFLPNYRTDKFSDFYEELRSQENGLTEGIVIKNINSTLIGNRKSSSDNPQWFKCKWRD